MANDRLKTAEKAIKHALTSSGSSRNQPFTKPKLELYDDLEITEAEGDAIVARFFDKKEQRAAGYSKIFMPTRQNRGVNEAQSITTISGEFFDARSYVQSTETGSISSSIHPIVIRHLAQARKSSGISSLRPQTPVLSSNAHDVQQMPTPDTSNPSPRASPQVRTSSFTSDNEDPIFNLSSSHDFGATLGDHDFLEFDGQTGNWTANTTNDLEFLLKLTAAQLGICTTESWSVDQLGVVGLVQEVAKEARVQLQIKQQEKDAQEQLRKEKAALNAQRRIAMKGTRLNKQYNYNRDDAKGVCGGSLYLRGRLRSGRKRART